MKDTYRARLGQGLPVGCGGGRVQFSAARRAPRRPPPARQRPPESTCVLPQQCAASGSSLQALLSHSSGVGGRRLQAALLCSGVRCALSSVFNPSARPLV